MCSVQPWANRFASIPTLIPLVRKVEHSTWLENLELNDAGNSFALEPMPHDLTARVSHKYIKRGRATPEIKLHSSISHILQTNHHRNHGTDPGGVWCMQRNPQLREVVGDHREDCVIGKGEIGEPSTAGEVNPPAVLGTFRKSG